MGEDSAELAASLGFLFQKPPLLRVSLMILGPALKKHSCDVTQVRNVSCLLVFRILLPFVNFICPKQVGGHWVPSRPWTEANLTFVCKVTGSLSSAESTPLLFIGVGCFYVLDCSWKLIIESGVAE